MPIFKKGYPRGYRYDIAREIIEALIVLERLHNRWKDYIHTREFTATGRKYMDTFYKSVLNMSKKMRRVSDKIKANN